MLDFSRKPIIGYVQLGELTGQNFDSAYSKGLLDATRLENGGADAIVVENYAEPEVGAQAVIQSKIYMESICAEIRKIARRAKLGVNVLPADVTAAFELAMTYNFDFVHADIYSDTVRSRETGAEIRVDLDYVSRFRRECELKAGERIPLIATVKPRHAYDVCGDGHIEQSARRAAEYGADAIAVVGGGGMPPERNDISRVESSVQIPVGAGSGMNHATLEEYFMAADFFLVSRFFRQDGDMSKPIDERMVRFLANRRRYLMARNGLNGI